MTVAEALQMGLQQHRAGRLAEAEAIYRQVLAAEPNNFDGLHLLGLVALQAGHAQVAIELMSRAVQINTNVAQAHINLAAAYRAVPDMDRAVAHARRAVEL